MSARGHRPRQTDARSVADVVGGITGFRFVGVSEWTANAHQDPADIVTFDSMVDDWLGAGFPGMNVAEVAGLRRERREAR